MLQEKIDDLEKVEKNVQIAMSDIFEKKLETEKKAYERKLKESYKNLLEQK